MTPPDWPAGIDYDETIRLVSRTIRQHYDRTTWGNEAASGVAAEAVDAIAPLIAKAGEEAEARGQHRGISLPESCCCAFGEAMCRDCLAGGHGACYKHRRIAAHEARKAGPQ